MRAVPLGSPERRFIRAAKITESGRMIRGRAASYLERTTVGDMFVEMLMPGAFAASIGGDVRLLQDHDPSRLLARTTNGTLRLDDKDDGLYFEASVAKTSAGDDLLRLIGRRDLDGCSFGFQIESDDDEAWSVDQATGLPLRIVRNLRLFDVSIVTYPQYQQTMVTTAGRQEDEPCACDDPDCDDPDCVERSRMIPAGAGRAQLELRSKRSRIMRALDLSDAELLERRRAQAALLLLETLEM